MNNIEFFRKQIKVINFKDINGKDPLWKMALESENEKGAEESMDLLVDLHLKFDN